MVDANLPLLPSDGKLRYLYLDLNSFFASVEQQDRPELRGRPVATVPVMADTSFVVAASYEAKAFGVKCGTMIRDARELCPGIEIVQCRAPLYVHYHKRILEVVEDVLPIDQVCSIDEVRFRLLGDEREPDHALALAKRMKQKILDSVGECLTCSVGVAPNSFLAKVGTEIQKPNGLVVLQKEDLPGKLYSLKLTDFPGINRRMQVRLNAAGIFTTEQMCRASKQELAKGFGSVIGEKWWYLLRGFETSNRDQPRKTLGHSHVLSPERRTDQGCREVLLRLLSKASARLRSEGLCAGAMSVGVVGFKKSWQARVHLPATQDSLTLNEAFGEVWPGRDFERPRTVGIVFYDLRPSADVTPNLFDTVADCTKLSHTIDAMNQKFGKNKVFLASTDRAKNTADEKIAFNKTWLFSEGKGDNEWVDTFTGRVLSSNG